LREEQHVSNPGKPRRRGRWPFGVALILIAGLAYAGWPRQADLTAFDPDEMARLETAMWRSYYEKRYPALFRDLYAVSRDQYHFSPFDSARIAYAAASAARTFQPTTSRVEAETALPALERYFRILSAGASIKVDVEDAARTELAWWQARREAVPPEQYGLIIAQVATLVYGVEGEGIRQSGLARAQAMAYRDQRGSTITEADWSVINEHLRSAYGMLKRALPAR
jgi:hypothetical protein